MAGDEFGKELKELNEQLMWNFIGGLTAGGKDLKSLLAADQSAKIIIDDPETFADILAVSGGIEIARMAKRKLGDLILRAR